MLRKLLQRIQHNHALEHATINLLSRRYPKAQIVGFSGPGGFTIYTNLTAEEVVPAARQALRHLKDGEVALAVHDNCGTNLVVTAGLTTIATVIGLGLRRKRRLLDVLERVPQAMLLNALAVMVATPLGHWVQTNVTTDPDVAGVEITSFVTDYQGSMRRVRVHTLES
ncbi:MAG: DUF6391 domain-containing protein [Anaerolineae bacterium]